MTVKSDNSCYHYYQIGLASPTHIQTTKYELSTNITELHNLVLVSFCFEQWYYG